MLNRHVQVLGRSEALGLWGRSRVRALLVREVFLGPARRATLRVAGTRIELGTTDDFPIDWKAFLEVFAGDAYVADYGGARVLDVGAHKGYFGAFALANGASFVLSFEPEARNFQALERAAAPLGERWLARDAAVGAAAGTTVLLLDRTSWAHSLLGVERPAGQQPVSTVTLEQALNALPDGGSRTIVKIDAEGSECDILGHAEPLERVDTLMVEWHPSIAPCSEEEIAAAVEPSGLVLVAHTEGVMRFERA